MHCHRSGRKGITEALDTWKRHTLCTNKRRRVGATQRQHQRRRHQVRTECATITSTTTSAVTSICSIYCQTSDQLSAFIAQKISPESTRKKSGSEQFGKLRRIQQHISINASVAASVLAQPFQCSITAAVL